MTRLQQRSLEGRDDDDSSCRYGPKSVFGKYSDAEMVAHLKVLALDPCNSEFLPTNIRPLWNQSIRVRKAMALADGELPRRKRKLQQLLKDLPGFEPLLTNQPSGGKLNRGQVSHASSASCLPNSIESAKSLGRKMVLDSLSSRSLLTFEDNISERPMYPESPLMGAAINFNSPCKDVIPTVDSDESVNCSNVGSPENVTSPEQVPSRNLDDTSHPLSSQVEDTPAKKHLQPPRRSIRLLNFTGDDLQKMVIPVGPRFQVDVPEWTSPQNGEDSDSDSSRWVGTRIWPIEGGRTGTATRAVGKGREELCSCLSPGSSECVQRHIIEERLLLLCDLGGVFFRMKLDETGEQISKSWTSKEQHNFELLARKNPISNGKDFLKHAMKCFPYKCRKDILSYYFNVFIPRRMSQQNRESKQVDTDDEEENMNCLDPQRKWEGRPSLCGSKGVKDRFLRLP